MDAIRHALNVLSWQEMTEADRPDREIWMNVEAINDHFSRLREKYASDAGTDEVVDLDQNELTRGLR